MRVNILGVTIDTYTTAEIVAKICQGVESKARLRIVTANPEMIYAAKNDPGLKQLINSADIVTADGVGVVWAARKLGPPVKERVTGIDLIQALFPLADEKQWRVFFLGGKPGVAEMAAAKVSREYPGIHLAIRHGYFSTEEEHQLLEQIKHFQADVLLVGMGAPRQEYWLEEHPGLAAVSMGVGGSFDALAGTVARAPQYMQDLHLEWFYRLWKEPRRWRRQSVLPRYVLKVLWQKYRQKFS